MSLTVLRLVLETALQLGVVLPKLREKIGDDLAVIVDELVSTLKSGTRDGETFDVEPVKELILKDLEIFLSDDIFPALVAKYTPATEVVGEPTEAIASE